ncbi:MAG: hypothetical protein ABIQ75_07805 [Flavobacteriales bacterium]
MKTKPRSVRKQAVLNTLKEMPERFDADDLIARIMLLQKVEEGMEDVRAGRIFSLEEMREQIAQKWSK